MSGASRQVDHGSVKEDPRVKGSPLFLLARAIFRVSFRLFFRLKVTGAENVPADGGVLVASNHQSFFDPIIVAISNRRSVFFMARDSLFRSRYFGWLLRNVGAFPVRRGAPDRKALREAVERLQAGAVLLVFPEGTRTRDGSLGPLHSGPAMLAFRAGVPIVPAVIKGAVDAWPRTKKIFRFRPISIAYGRPLPPPATGERETCDEIRRKLQDSLESLMQEA
jgi:1-acyl-sn-glycerol-3-phosphate acyltransferase